MSDIDTPSARQPVDQYEDMARSLIRISFVLRRDMQAETEFLSSVTREILRIVVRQPGLSVSEIARITLRQQSNTSTAVHQLEDMGFVRRELSPLDRRSAHIYPTSKASDVHEALYQGWARLLHASVEKLSPAERRRVQAAIPGMVKLTTIIENSHMAADG